MEQYGKFAEWYDIMYNWYDHSADCDYLEAILQRYSTKKAVTLLDIGCGTGTHALELEKRGYKVSGIDISEGQIARAKEKSIQSPTIEYHVADMRQFKLEQKFDASVSFFGSMGYVTGEGEIERALECIHSHLHDGGLFVFEFWNARGVIPNNSSWLKAEKDDIRVIRLSKSEFNPETNIITIDFDAYVLSKTSVIDAFTETHTLRVYTPREMKHILEGCGFALVGIFDNLTFNISDKDPFRLTAIARAEG
ncbi:MAG: class I SAM-dependent DNA methyltransferase [Candidatus Thorarchaeota archaeon]